MDWLRDPGVIAAFIMGAVTLFAPRVAAQIKRIENGRIDLAAVEVRRIDATEKRLQEILDRQASEIDQRNQRIEALEARAQTAEHNLQMMGRKFDRVLVVLGDAARELRGELEDDPRQAIADQLVRAIAQTRDLFINGEKSA